MTDQEIQVFAEQCGKELELKQKGLKDIYGLSGRDEYVLDLDKHVLCFEKDGVEISRFSVTIIGSLAPVSKNWLWGWANESLNEKNRDRAASLKALYDETGFDLFRVGTFKADGGLAEDLSALAIHKLGAAGLYKVSGGDDQGESVRIYLALFPEKSEGLSQA